MKAMTEETNKKPRGLGRGIAYWVTTALVAAEMGVGGVWDVLRIPYVRTILGHLGYPLFLAVIMGVWKVPGAVVLLAPRLPRLKEWAYAGAVFTYTGAVASHLSVGDGAGAVVPPAVFAGLAMASWALRPPDRRDLAAS
jgi:DoxX-like protein